ncbi:MAG: Wzz/FepE/Etk N-terminal domain-containing protein [Acidobacteriota bacterium]
MPDETGPGLRWYALKLWERRVAIGVAAAACAAVGLALALLSTPSYLATATIVVSQSKVGEEMTAAPSPGAASFVPLVRNHATAQVVIEKRGLNKPPYSLTAFTFLDRVFTVAEVRNTNLLTASAALPDAKLASDVVNDMASAAVELSHKLSQQEAVRARDIIGEHVKDLNDRLEAAQARLLDFQRTHKLDLLRGDVESLLEQRKELAALLVKLAAERGRLESAERELKARSRTTSVTKSIDSDPAMMEAARQRGQKDLLGLELRTESPNQVFESLDQEVATARSNVAALERQRAQLAGGNRLDSKKQDPLSALYQQENALDRLKLDYELARSAYGEAAEKFENATLQVASRSAELQVVDPAVPSDRPVSPRPIRDTLMWLVAGLVISSAAFLAVAAISPDRR